MGKEKAGPKTNRPIYDADAEKYVIGSIIADPACLAKVDLDPNDFYINEYRQLYDAILNLCQGGEEITQASVMRIARGVPPHWLSAAISDADASEYGYYAETVGELGRSRRLIGFLRETLQQFNENGNMSSIDLADMVRLNLESFQLPTKKARTIRISEPKIISASPPIYIMTVSTFAGDISKEVQFNSIDLDTPKTFRRKVRECLEINPVLPKDFDSFIHGILQRAKTETAPGDTSREESICYWITEWFSTASEAEGIDDLAQGYVEKHEAYWFSPDRLANYISDRRKERLDRNGLWAVIHDRGGRRLDKVIRLGDKTARLWGLDKSFFERYTLAEEDQISLQANIDDKGDEDLTWLEQ